MIDYERMPEPVARMFRAMRGLFSRCVVPIYFTAGGNPGLEGTGTLFRIGDEFFLVTAAHVVGKENDGTRFYITDGTDGAPSIPLAGKVFVSDDLFDVAVWPLDPAVVDRLRNRRFLRLTDVDLAPECRPGLFFVHGFPVERKGSYDGAAATMKVQSFTHAGGLYNGSAALRTYRREFHILVSIDRNNVVTEDGSRPEFPRSLKGISGGSIWQAIRNGESPDTWTIEQAKVVGVETRVHKSDESIVQGTRWHAVLVLLWKQYPAIRPALELHLPQPLRT